MFDEASNPRSIHIARFIYVRYASSLVKEGVQLLHGVAALFLLVSIMTETIDYLMI